MLCEDEKRTSLQAGMKMCGCTKHQIHCYLQEIHTIATFFWGPQLKNLHFVLAKCLKWRRNHDPYSTKTTSKRGKNGNFQR